MLKPWIVSKVDETDGAYGTYGGEAICIEDFGGKTRNENTT
jgi:hypothetical protein